MSPPSSPTDQAIKHALELELEDDDHFHNIQLATPSSSQVDSSFPSMVPVHQSSQENISEDQQDFNDLRSPHANSSQRPLPTSSSSFRSIAPSFSLPLPGGSSSKSVQDDPISSDSQSTSASGLHSTENQISGSKQDSNRPESFAEVTLDDDPVAQESLTTDEAPLPSMNQEKTLSPPQKASFFTTALSFASSSPTTPSLDVNLTPSTPTRSPLGSAAGPSTWRSTVTNLLGGRSPADTPASSSSALPMGASEIGAQSSASTSFLLQRIQSPTASRDRRISREVGATDRLREGFERVRSEMEGAAREMRREEARSPETTSINPAGDIDWVFWGAVVQDYEDVARSRPKELSRAIQQGIPHVIRGAIWQLMSSSKSVPLEETYKALLKLSSPHEKAIVKDINRTFPNHKYFKDGGGMGQESLYMVVKAYSLYDQEVGYTQGLAFIVAALLLNMPDEEAFCVLVRLMGSYNLRSHFLADMPGLQLRLFQFDRLVEEILPLLHTHMTRKGVKSSMFASQWFMTLFSYRFPLSLVYRVLDIVFAEGIEAIFRFAVALLRKSEDKLIQLDFEQILAFLQTDLFEMYRSDNENSSSGANSEEEEECWRANDFVRDAYEIRITPFMLDSYESEYDEHQRTQNKHALELDQLRNANRSLSAQVKQLESSLATINQEHVELVRQLVMSKLEKEEIENELVRYKMLYAELAHAQQDALSNHSRFSAGSNMSYMGLDLAHNDTR